MHHDLVIATVPMGVDVMEPHGRDRGCAAIAFEVADRDELLCALAHLHSRVVVLIFGPTIHGFEMGSNLIGSGSRSFHFLDPDGNRLEIYTEMIECPTASSSPGKGMLKL